jgi:xylulokinase
MAFLGVDIGTGGCKATVCDERGNMYGSAYASYETIRENGRHELNSAEVWEKICIVIREAVTDSPEQKVEAICTSSLGETVVPVDKNGNILGNAMVYTDCRGDEELNAICNEVGRLRVGSITGLPPSHIFAICKVVWLKKHEPELYEKTYKFLEFEDFLTFMLTGQAYISYSLASRTMAFDVVRKCWSNEILLAAGVPESKFSKPCSTGTIIGQILPDMAQRLHLPKKTKVIVGAQDQICASVGAGILEDGMAVDGMGSTHCITAVLKRPIINESTINKGYCCCPHAINGMYATYAYNFSGGNLIRWFRDTFARYEYETCREKGINIYQYLDEMACNAESDLLVLPHFTGGGPPYMDDGSRGMICGMSLNTTLQQIYRAFMEGISFEMRNNLDELADKGTRIHKLRACGGGANSKVWLQMQSDIFGIPIEQLRTSEAGTLGCAAICGKALGYFKNLQDGVSVYLDIGETYMPNPEKKEYYNKKYIQYKQMYRAGRLIRNVTGERRN